MSLKETLKRLVKGESSPLTETAMLDQYLSSRGINPKFVSRDTKVSHAKSAEYLKWKQDHKFESVEFQEEVDKEDTITFDIPLFIRVLEFAREDAKDDMSLHKMTERLISIRDRGTLTMDDYDFITKLKEEMGLDESALEKWRKAASEREKKHNQAEKEMKARHAQGKEDMKGSIDRLEKALNKEEHQPGDRVTVDSKFFGKQKGEVVKVDKQSVHVKRDGKNHQEKYPHDAVVKEESEFMKDVMKKFASSKANKYSHYSKTDKEQGRPVASKVYGQMAKHQKKLSQEEVEQIDELNYDTVKSLYDKRRDDYRGDKVGEKKKGKKVSAKNVSTSISRLMGFKPTQNKPEPKHKPTSENTLDPKAATEAPCDCANGGETTEVKRQMSKSARMIKALYKKKGVVKEDLYDQEKEDKSVASYGKKPKHEKNDDDAKGDKAAAIVSGGKTLTGEKRDTIEIDPMMKNRPNDYSATEKSNKK